MARRRFNKRRSSRRSNKRWNPMLERKTKQQYYRRKLKPSQTTLINNTKPSLNIPLNPRYLTKFTSSILGYVPAGVNNGYFVVKLNSPFQPYNNGAFAFTAPANNTGVLLGSVPLTVAPRGYSNLIAANMYQKYRVYASRIKVTAVSGNVGDNLLIAVTPTNNSTFSTAGAVAYQNVAFSKEKIINNGGDMESNTIINYIDVNSLDGLTKEQLMADDSKVGTLAGNPTDLSYWIINYQTTSATATVAQLGFNIELIHYTECFELNYEDMSIV